MTIIAVRNGFRTSVRLAAALAIALAVTLPAFGQAFRVPPSYQQAFEADYQRRDLPIFVEYLSLDEGQQSVVASIYEAYEAKFNEGADRVRAEVREMRPERQGMDEASQEELRNVRDKLRELTGQMREKVSATDDPAERRAIIEEFQRQTEALRETMRDLRPERRDPAELDQLMITMADATQRWKKEKDALARAFVEDVRLALNEDQVAQWPALERRLRRDKTLRLGRLSAESINHFDLIRELDFEPQITSTLNQTLTAYDARLDEALRVRNEIIESTADEQFRARLIEDQETLESIAQQQAEAHRTVRNLNIEFAREIQALLPTDEADQYQELFNERAFSRVYRRTNMERSIEAARNLEDIDPEVVTVLDELEAAFIAELAPQNERIKQTILAHEHEQADFEIERRPRRREPGDASFAGNPIRDAYGERNELEERYMARLKELLTPEQFESIPYTRRFARGNDGRRGGRFEGRRGGGGLERQQEIMDEFDVDKDGRLSPEEIEALRESLRERRRNRGGGGRE